MCLQGARAQAPSARDPGGSRAIVLSYERVPGLLHIHYHDQTTADMATMMRSATRVAGATRAAPLRRAAFGRVAVSRRASVQVQAAAPLVGNKAPDFKATAVFDQVRGRSLGFGVWRASRRERMGGMTGFSAMWGNAVAVRRRDTAAPHRSRWEPSTRQARPAMPAPLRNRDSG